MVTGHHAFNGPSYSDVLVAICTEPLPNIREKAPWLPETVGAWFEKACARELVDRFQSADEMVEALREAAGPHSRLSRASVPEDVSGPSGTIVGHAPPHVMNTVAVAAVNVDLDQPASDDTLRSRTGPLVPAEPRRDSQDAVVTARGKSTGLGYVLFALSGVGLALALVLGALVVRYAYRIMGSNDQPTTTSPIVVLPAAPESIDSVVHPTPPSTPGAPAPTPPSNERATPPASAATETPVAIASPNGPRRVPASVPPTQGRAGAPLALPSATPESPKALEPAAPDMGF
jgi:hypothetical protein